MAPPYYDVPPSAYGGIEAVVAELADALVAHGHQVTLVGAGVDGTQAEFRTVWNRTIPERLGHPFSEVAHAAMTRRIVEDLADAGAVDVVHDHTVAGPLNAPAYARIGLPTLATVHGPIDSDLCHLYRALGTDISLVALSHRQRMLAPDLNWISTVPNALRLDTWPYGTEKDDYALFLGRFNEDKGPHWALEAAHLAGLRLILAGKCSEQVEIEFFDHEIKPRLTDGDEIFGVADATDKRKLLLGARCLLFPVQWEEPFGMVMIEAMACGTPVVALRAGAVPEVVIDGVTGIICDEPTQLPAALEACTKLDPAACRAHVARRFSADRLATGYVAAYRRALATSRHAPRKQHKAIVATPAASSPWRRGDANKLATHR